MVGSLVSPREFKSVKTMNVDTLHTRPNGIAIKLTKKAKNLRTGVRKQPVSYTHLTLPTTPYV